MVTNAVAGATLRPMTDDRRRFPRDDRPIYGVWLGASGSAKIRFGDLSMGGCFAQTLIKPKVGDHTSLSVDGLDGAPIVLKGRVVSVDPTLGFAIEYEDMDQASLDRLRALLESPR